MVAWYSLVVCICNIFCKYPIDNHPTSCTKPSLGQLLNDVAVKVNPRLWKNSATQLELHATDIDCINQEEQGKVDDCFREVFSLWERIAIRPYTWTTVIAALEADCVGENRVAIELKKKYQNVSNQSAVSSLGKHPRDDSDAPNDPPQKQQRQT